MFCTKCGSNIADGAKFCPNCGNNMQNIPVVNSTVQAGIKQVTTVNQKKKILYIFLPIFSALLTLLVGLLVFYYFYSNSLHGTYYFYSTKDSILDKTDFYFFDMFGSYKVCFDGKEFEHKYKRTGDYMFEEVLEPEKYKYKSGYLPDKFIVSLDQSKITVLGPADGELALYGIYYKE